MVEPIAKLKQAAEAKGLGFLIIGGHAVTQHGYSRATDDLDVLICSDAKADWLKVANSLGYRLLHDGGSFLQFDSEDSSGWPLDFMLVRKETFSPMVSDSVPGIIQGIEVKFPSVEHLLALKLHAIKWGHPRRVMKDLYDLLQVVDASGVDVESQEFMDMVERHADQDIYKQILRYRDKEGGTYE